MNNQYTDPEKIKKNYPEYKNWRSMIKRSTCKTDNHYFGIHIYSEWYDFFTFLKDVGNKPSNLHTLDRIDGSKGYIPGNVRWATKEEQQLNRKVQKNNKSGVKGVSKRGDKWRAVFKRKELGLFSSIEEAEVAYNKARNDYIV